MVALYVAAGASFAALSARGLTVPLYAHDLGASRFEVGALFSVSTLAAALLSLPSGILVDRFGARALLGISFLLAAVSQLATAATPSVFPLFIWQVVGGLAAGAQQAALFSAVTESTSGGRLGRAGSIHSRGDRNRARHGKCRRGLHGALEQRQSDRSSGRAAGDVHARQLFDRQVGLA